MTQEQTREEEIRLFLREIVWQSYPGNRLEDNVVFKVCRELKSPYCLSFNETGYNQKFQGFDPEEVNIEVARHITDSQLEELVSNNKKKLWIRNFYGKYFTFDGKTKEIIIGSQWYSIKKETNSRLLKFSNNGYIVLEAIYEVNYYKVGKYKNYYPVLTLAKDKGFSGIGWREILSELQLAQIIHPNGFKDLYINDEMRPLVEEILHERKKGK